jgi:hypothetical protein
MRSHDDDVDVVLLRIIPNHFVNRPFTNRAEILDSRRGDPFSLLVERFL